MFARKRAEPVNDTAKELPSPKDVAATGNWRGNDGKWSTFFINVGDKDNNGGGQNFEILPSTHSGVTILPLKASWCTGDCPEDRGVGTVKGVQMEGVKTDASTWNNAGTYDIATPDWWQNKSDTPGGLYGLEFVGIGQASSQSYIAKNMYIAGTTSKDFYIGQFGLGVGATNVGKGNGNVQSILATFQNESTIPSVSYGYTAGAKYRNNDNGIYGSFVLGGYDEARISPDINRISVKMVSDKNTTLAVGVQGISYQPNVNVDQNNYGLTENNTKGFWATIDSTLPYLLLPDEVCDRFALRFNLQYNNRTNFYTLNSTGAANNEQQNGTVTFKLGSNPSGSGADFTSIKLPYKAFELEYFDPENPDDRTPYFPIRRSNNGRFVLGRTFLQEAYIIVDYKRANFTVAPVPILDSRPDPKLVPIYDPSYTPTSLTPTTPEGDSRGLSGGAIAGIVIGILAVALGVAFGIFIWWKKRRARKNTPPTYKEATEIDTSITDSGAKQRRISELDSQLPKSPLGGFYGEGTERKDLSPFPPISEMDSPPAELYSPPAVAATPHSEGNGVVDYFTAGGKLGRRGATRESSANNTPGTPPPFTPIAELPADDVVPLSSEKGSPKLASGSVSKRDPSATRSRSNIDEVMKREASPVPPPKDGSAADATEKQPDAEAGAVAEGERRPSHTRGASDTTVQSDITVVSQPTPDELESWALAEDEQPRRPLSE